MKDLFPFICMFIHTCPISQYDTIGKKSITIGKSGNTSSNTQG